MDIIILYILFGILFWLLVSLIRNTNQRVKKIEDRYVTQHCLKTRLADKADRPRMNVGGKHEFGHDYD